MIAALYCQRCFIAGVRMECIKAPAYKELITTLYLQKSWFLSRSKRHLKTIKRNEQPLATGLDICFLSCPAIKECVCTFLGLQSSQLRAFFRREETFGDFSAGKIWLDQFHINSKLPLVRDRKQCNFTGMRKIKSKAGRTLGCCQIGLALRAIDKFDLMRLQVQICPKQLPHRTTGNRKLVPVFCKIETVSTLNLIRCQKFAVALDHCFRLDQANSPNMNIAWPNGACIRRGNPKLCVIDHEISSVP